MEKKQLLLICIIVTMATVIYVPVLYMDRFGATRDPPSIHPQRRAYDTGSQTLEYYVAHSQGLSTAFPWLSHPEMRRRLSLEEYNDQLRLLAAFASLMESVNVTYILYYGSLLGSYRMHNMLPWDDDIDVIVNYDDLCKIIESIQNEAKKGIYQAVSRSLRVQRSKLYDGIDFRDLDCKAITLDNTFLNFKFFHSNATAQKKWKWPFIDLYFFQENTTHVSVLLGKKYTTYLTRDVFFPLTRRPFGGLWMPSPRNSSFVLHSQYGDFRNVCVTGANDHRHGRVSAKITTVKCEELRLYYPWVSRRLYMSYTEEHLMFKNKTIHSVTIR